MARFTAMQASRLEVAHKLLRVREDLYACRSAIVWGEGEHRAIDDIDNRVTELLSKLIPNSNTATGPQPGERDD